MRYLLQLEWLKWRHHRAFQIFLLAYLVLLPTVLLLGKKIPELPPPVGTTEMLYIFPTIWQYLGLVGNWISFFLFGFLSVVMITSEYSYRTVRQNIMTGLTRTNFLLGKIYFFVVIALFATLYYVLIALVIGYIHTDIIRWGKVWQYWDYIPRYFLMCFGYMTLGLFISFLVRRTGLSLFLYFGYAMVGEMLVRWLPHFYFFPNKTIHYYPVKAFSDLLPMPFSQMAEEFIREYNFSLFLTSTESVTISLIYIIVFLVLVFQWFKRVDL